MTFIWQRILIRTKKGGPRPQQETEALLNIAYLRVNGEDFVVTATRERP